MGFLLHLEIISYESITTRTEYHYWQSKMVNILKHTYSYLPHTMILSQKKKRRIVRWVFRGNRESGI